MTMKSELAPMFQRIENARNGFIGNVVEQFGKTLEEAGHVLAVFKHVKAVKLDPIGGRYILTHGAYWEQDVIDSAAHMHLPTGKPERKARR